MSLPTAIVVAVGMICATQLVVVVVAVIWQAQHRN
jgi:hypothetical protein